MRCCFRGRLVKVIATLGPSSSSIKVMKDMVLEGVDGFRINFSHGDPDFWDHLLDNIRLVEDQLGIHLAVIGDLEGPKIRLGDFGDPIKVSSGDTIDIFYGEEKPVAIDSEEFFKTIEPGDYVLIDDGRVKLRIEEVEGYRAKAKVIYGRTIHPRKGVVIVGKDIYVGDLTSKDKECIRYIANNSIFSHIMVSYANSGKHIHRVREYLKEANVEDIDILAKIETPKGVDNVDEIARESDGIVIARGDLGMHFDLDKLPLIQEYLTSKALSQRKPVVIATEILSSMVENSTPLRSEIVDIYEGIKSAIDAFLLTSETAIGRNPVNVVRWLAKSISTLQKNYRKIHEVRVDSKVQEDRLAKGIVELFESLDSDLLVYSMSGRFAKRISSYRPRNPFYVGVPNPKIERLIRILWGAQPILVKANDYQEGLQGLSKIYSGVFEKRSIVVKAAWIRFGNTYEITVSVA